MEKLFSGIWWIDALRVWGIAFTALLVGFVAYAAADWFMHRRLDAAEFARLLPKPPPKPVKNAPKVTKRERTLRERQGRRDGYINGAAAEGLSSTDTTEADR